MGAPGPPRLPPPPNLPQQRHVVLGVDWAAEDVAFQGGHGLLEPEEQGVAGAQADLRRDGQGEYPVFAQLHRPDPITSLLVLQAAESMPLKGRNLS